VIAHAKALAVALIVIDAMLYGASVTAKVTGRDPQPMLGNHGGAIQAAATLLLFVCISNLVWRRR